MIETTRLKIVPFSEEHLTQRYVGWLNDPEVVRYSEQRYRVHTLESCEEYMRSFDHTPNFFWALIARDVDLGHIGNINAYVDVSNNVADVGILIGEKQAWKRGFGLEAWTAVCDYLLHVANLRKITAGTLAVNSGMLQIMRRAGMIEDGRRIGHCLYEGREVDVIHMALFRNGKEGHIRR